MLQTFLGDILNVAFSSCEQEEPGLLGLALEVVKEPRARVAAAAGEAHGWLAWWCPPEEFL